MDVRRVWNCPDCGKTVKTPVNVSSQKCSCKSGETWMTLVEEPHKKPDYTPKNELGKDREEEVERPKQTQPEVTKESAKPQQPVAAEPVTEQPEPTEPISEKPVTPPPAEPKPPEPDASDDFGAGLD